MENGSCTAPFQFSTTFRQRFSLCHSITPPRPWGLERCGSKSSELTTNKPCSEWTFGTCVGVANCVENVKLLAGTIELIVNWERMLLSNGRCTFVFSPINCVMRFDFDIEHPGKWNEYTWPASKDSKFPMQASKCHCEIECMVTIWLLSVRRAECSRIFNLSPLLFIDLFGASHSIQLIRSYALKLGPHPKWMVHWKWICFATYVHSGATFRCSWMSSEVNTRPTQ